MDANSWMITIVIQSKNNVIVKIYVLIINNKQQVTLKQRNAHQPNSINTALSCHQYFLMIPALQTKIQMDANWLIIFASVMDKLTQKEQSFSGMRREISINNEYAQMDLLMPQLILNVQFSFQLVKKAITIMQQIQLVLLYLKTRDAVLKQDWQDVTIRMDGMQFIFALLYGLLGRMMHQQAELLGYEIKEACYADSKNFQFIWDINLSKCFSYQCIDYCGNGIVTNQDEQCDDGNYLPYDGCYECQVQCPQRCNIFNCRQCQKCNKIEWQLVEGVCSSKCCDGIAVGNEQYDDGNNIKFDGCYQCSYQCDEIQIVSKGNKMNQNVKIYEEMIFSIAIRINQKQLKCSRDHNFSFCSYAILPKIILTKLSKTDTTYQEFKLSFFEPVCLNEKGISEEQFLQLIFVQILNVKDNDYDIEIKSMISISTQQVKVYSEKHYKQLREHLVLKGGKIRISVFLQDVSLSIVPYVQDFHADQDLEFLFYVGIQRFYGIYLIAKVILRSLLLALLLQLLINYQSIRIYKDLFNFQIPKIQTKWKFQYYEIDCYFLQNLQMLLVMLMIGSLYYIISYLFQKFLVFKNYKNWQQFIRKIIIISKLLNLHFSFRRLQENIISILFNLDLSELSLQLL
ncbi:unnamed protein product [Paramecium octaurelia]|uniref:Uncharacterized protein n=1 Tax=Paramecium octaurelia TaxID=43137 RepID=A0A8S1UIT6_PAROT|nr:unnamed protein product [Paramecium octaurelia]